jgi:hypothetical protein
VAVTADGVRLVRGIRKWDVVALVLNAIIGAGIFGLPSRVFAMAGVRTVVVEEDRIGVGTDGLLDEAFPVARHEHPRPNLLIVRTRHDQSPTTKAPVNQIRTGLTVNETFPDLVRA